MLFTALLRSNRDEDPEDRMFDIIGPDAEKHAGMMKIGPLYVSYDDVPELVMPAGLAHGLNEMLERQGEEWDEASAKGFWAQAAMMNQVSKDVLASPLRNSMLEGVGKMGKMLSGIVAGFSGPDEGARAAGWKQAATNLVDTYGGFAAKSAPGLGILNNAFIRDVFQMGDGTTVSQKTLWDAGMYTTFGVAWKVSNGSVEGVDYRGNKVVRRPYQSIFDVNGEVSGNGVMQYLFPVAGDPKKVQEDIDLMNDLGIEFKTQSVRSYWTVPEDDSKFLGEDKMTEEQYVKLNELANKKFGEWLDNVKSDPELYKSVKEMSKTQTPERKNALMEAINTMMSGARSAAREEMKTIPIEKGGFMEDGKNVFLKMK